MSVLGYDFWRDPTHVRFYDPLALQFFARQAGFAIVASGGNPFNHPGPPPALLLRSGMSLPSLGESICETVQRARRLYRERAEAPAEAADDARSTDNAESGLSTRRLWSESGNVLSLLDERTQALQHDLHTLRTAHENLLHQLYPANEVYVAASVPLDPRQVDVGPPSSARIEGTA